MSENGDTPDALAASLQPVLARILDGGEATTGGGSAAALSGAMAAGLLGMVARLSAGRALELGDARYRAVTDEAGQLCAALASGSAEDAAAYGLIRAAYAHPKDTARERAARAAAIHEALIAAAEVPLDNARRCARVLDLCRELVGRSNETAASDLAVALELAGAGLLGCAGNVDVNVAMLEGERAAALLREADELRALLSHTSPQGVRHEDPHVCAQRQRGT
jgi:formiminotetrahydrofolate cyclodeaminase